MSSKDTTSSKANVGWRSVFELCAGYWKQSPLKLAITQTLLVSMVCVDVMMPLAAGMLVDRLVGVINEGGTDYAPVFAALSLFAFASITFYVLAHIRQFIWHRFEAEVMERVISDGFWKVQRFSADWHASTFAGATVRKLTRGKWAIEAINNIVLKHFFQLALTVTAFTFVMWERFPIIGILFLVGTIVYIGISVSIASTFVRSANLRAAYADSSLGAFLADSVSNNPTVKSFGAENREDELLEKAGNRWAGLAVTAWDRGMILGFVQQMMWMALQVAMLFVLIRLSQNGQATPGDAAFILTATFRLRGFVGQVGEHIRNLQRATSDFADMVQFANTPLQVPNLDEAQHFETRGGKIELDRVSFGYGGGDKPLYENFSLTIQPGERIGLVGPSGSGKSTFVKLIQRLYDVNSGEIRIDGVPIHHTQQEELRRTIALVPQDPSLFHRTLAENIAYGRPEASLEEIELASRRAHAEDFIERLPQRYETLVGERGVKLSGGERQRVAIARAFLADTPIVIFDEATSSLDTITEKRIQTAMEELMENRTTIVVAHRLSTVRDLDRILVFDRGRIVEEGTHESLIQIVDGRYRALYRMQAEQGQGMSAELLSKAV